MSEQAPKDVPVVAAEPMVVAYADGISRFVNVHSENDEIVFVIPRKLSFWVVFSAALAAAGPMTAGMLLIGFQKAWTAAMLPIFQGIFMGVFFLVFTLRNSRKDFVIRLTPTHLKIGPVLGPDGKSERSIARERIYRVAYVEHSGNLVVRATGEEMLEIRPTREALALRFIARELSRQLKLADQSEEPELRASSAS